MIIINTKEIFGTAAAGIELFTDFNTFCFMQLVTSKLMNLIEQ